MALTERYVSVAGGGLHDGTSEANAFTFAEMITDMATPRTGHRYNMISGSYSSGAVALTAGTISAPNIIRGYTSTIGDLDNQGRNADGSLDTTNFPDLTLTGVITPAAGCVLQNLDVTGSLSSRLVWSNSVDEFTIMNCRFINSASNAAAGCILLDNGCALVNSDFACTGSPHLGVVEVDTTPVVAGCRFEGTQTGVVLLDVAGGEVKQNAFWGNSGSIGISAALSSAIAILAIEHNTFYGIGTCIQLANSAPVAVRPLLLRENHATDCSKWIENLHATTISTIEIRNRLRDVTTPRTGIEAVLIGEITTDTGGAETDYTDAPNDNFHLITTAPGYNAGMAGADIGAYQTDPPAGGGGGGGPLVGGRLVR